jgi:hypothetical protein
LGFVVIVGLLVATALFVSTANERNAAGALRTTQAQLAAEAGLEQAVDEVWYKVWNGDPPSTMAAYREKADEAFPDGKVKYFPDGTSFTSFSNDDNEGYRVEITRADDPNHPGVHFIVHATGRLAGGKTVRYLAQDFYVSPGIFQGFDFALLTNNANCILCHTDIKSVDAFKSNPTQKTPWNKARVGVLDTLQIRFGQDVPNNPKSKIAGTIYLRGNFIGTGGQDITDKIGETTLSTSLEPGSEQIVGSNYGSFSITDCQIPMRCGTNHNFYKNYPDAAKVNKPLTGGGYGGKWPDGPLPDHFPLPVPDTNGDRIIDDGEWQAAVDNSISGKDLDNPKGSITGSAKVYTANQTVTSSGWATVSNTTIKSGACTGSQSINDVCNVILDGHTTPLDIEGTVYINGDVIIRGKIKGSGKIVARGNVYVEGDLQYACTGNSICTDEGDWQDPSKLPKFALAAGGNMLIGDYETPRYADFTKSSVLETGAPQCVSSCGTDHAKNSTPGFSWREINLFNRLEIKKWLANSDYTPRLYAFRQKSLTTCAAGDEVKNSCDTNGLSNSIDFWNNPSTEGKDAYNDPGYIKIARGCLTNVDECPSGGIDFKINSTSEPRTAEEIQAMLKQAAIYNLSPTDNWISEESLKELWAEGFQNNSTRGQKALRTDGMLYSANAIFELSRPPDEPAPEGAQAKTGGQWDLRGALIAADTGILTPGPKTSGMTNYDSSGIVGLSLYHDDRLSDFLKIRDKQDAKLFRSHWRVTTSSFK